MKTAQERYPITPHPDGWYAAALSHELAAGEVMPLEIFGRDLVLFRTESGEPHVLDAFCAHLGAHLGHGGKVEGDCIVCPFHAWKYAANGKCVEVPGGGRLPAARMQELPVVERNGVITVWHHHQGKDPFCEIPEFGDEGWSDKRWVELDLEMHIFDVAENGVDTGHFTFIHKTKRSEIELHDDSRIPFRFKLMTSYPGDGIGIVGEHVKVTTDWQYYGPGMFHSTTNADDFGMRVRQLFYFTPIADGKVKFRVGVSGDKSTIPDEGMDFVLAQNEKIIVANLLEDADIWKYKTFFSKPALRETDGLYHQLRHWMRQFYPELASTTAGTGSA